MIGTLTTAQYKALTSAQRAKYRKAIAAYEAERNPIMYEANRHENEVRRQAYIDLNCEERVEQVRAQYDPRIKSIRENIEALWNQVRELEAERNDAELEITSEPYRVAYSDSKREALHDVWKSITERHEAKMANLLASFKSESEVA